MLTLKLALAPALIGLATLAARRWGPQAAGWMASLPVVAGPILLVVALERGPAFASTAAGSATAGLVSLATFVTAYAALALAGRPSIVALVGGWSAFATTTGVLWTAGPPRAVGILLALLPARWAG